MLELFRSVHYRDPELKDYIFKRRFPVSTLARLYEYDKFQELAQIEVNQDKARVTLRGSKQQFSLLAEKIISDIKSRRIDTRVLNSTQSPTYQDYMKELRDFINEPPPSKSKTGTSSTTGGASTGGGAASEGGSATGSGGASGNGKGSQNGQGGGKVGRSSSVSPREG